MTMPKGWKAPPEEDKTGNIEHKKWQISQLQRLTDDLSSEILSDKVILLDSLSTLPQNLKDTRTLFISLVTPLIAIFIGLKENPIIAPFFPWVPLLLINVLSVAVLIIELSRSSVESSIRSIGNGYDIINLRLNILKGFISKLSMDIKYFTEDQLKVFQNFVFIYYQDRTDLAKRYDDAANSFPMIWYKGTLAKASLIAKQITNISMNDFKADEFILLKNDLVRSFFNTPQGREYLNRYHASPIRT